MSVRTCFQISDSQNLHAFAFNMGNNSDYSWEKNYIYTEKKVKTLHVIVMYLQKEILLVIKMHIQVKWLDYPSKQEVNDWNQRRRHRNVLQMRYWFNFSCAHFEHTSRPVSDSHQESDRKTPNPVILHESVKGFITKCSIILETNLEIRIFHVIANKNQKWDPLRAMKTFITKKVGHTT